MNTHWKLEGLAEASMRWASVLAIVPFLFLSAYNHPAIDDYCHAAIAMDEGFLRAQEYWYTCWSGRYFSSALISIYPLCWDFFVAYKVVSCIGIILFICSVWCFLHALAGQLLTLKRTFWCSLLFSAIYVTKLPYPLEAFHWLTAATTYQYGITAGLFALAVTIHAQRASGYRRPVLLAIGCVLSVCAVGTNEIMTINFVIIVGTVVILGAYLRESFARIWAIILMTSCIFAGVSLLAPGNIARSNTIAVKHEFMNSLISAVVGVGQNYLKWAADPIVMAAAVVTAVILGQLIAKGHPLRRITFKLVLEFVSLWVGLAVLDFFLVFWLQGTSPPHRAVNFMYFMFLLGWFACAFELVVLMTNIWPHFQIPGILVTALYLIIALGILVFPGKNNFRTAVGDLNGNAQLHDAQLQERYVLIRDLASKGVENIQVPILRPDSAMLFVSDIPRDPAHWANQCMSRFFGVKALSRQAGKAVCPCE